MIPSKVSRTIKNAIVFCAMPGRARHDTALQLRYAGRELDDEKMG